MIVHVMSYCIFSAILATSWASAVVAGPSVPVASSSFAAPVNRVAWAGSSAAFKACDTKCRDDCFVSVAAAGAHWGDASSQRTEVCVAACGCGAGSNNVFVLTSGEAHFSSDAGATWTNLQKNVPNNVMRGKAYMIKAIHVSHVDPRYVVAITNITTSLLSSDGGNIWRPLIVTTKSGGDEAITSWQWHPTKRDLALVGTMCHSHGHHRMFYTVDGGVTWKLFLEHAVQCNWAALPGGDPRRVIATVEKDNTHDGSLVEVIASNDFMISRQELLGKAVKGGPQAATKVHIHYSFTLALAAELSADGSPVENRLELWLHSQKLQKPNVSAPAVPIRTAAAVQKVTAKKALGEVDAPFSPVHWPVNMRPPRAQQLRNLEVLYSSENYLLFYMPSQDPSLPWGHIFRCTSLSAAAELVLSDVHKPSEFVGPQWRAVSGLDGVFVANRVIIDKGQDLDIVERKFDGQAAELLADRETAQSDDVDDAELQDEIVQGDNARGDMLIRTYLSVDAGIAWQPLQGPLDDVAQLRASRPAASNGLRDISLHLGQWISSAAAPGVLLGVGNMGLRLSDNLEHRSVFVSRDAGLSWKLVLKGQHQVAILSHADVLVAVPAKNPGLVKYSSDGGGTWRDVAAKSSDVVEMVVKSVFVHPSHTDWRVLIAMGSDGTRDTTLVTLDFSNLLATSCKKGDAVDPTVDLEKWSPADALEDAHTSKRPVCFLGVRTHYWRRKADRQCKTGELQISPLDLREDTPCACRTLDWACDAGYYRASYKAAAPCVLLEGTPEPNVTLMCTSTTSDHVQVTRGYVKVPGNGCNGGVDYSPRNELCEANTGLSGMWRRAMVQERSSSLWLLMVIAMAIAMHLINRRRSDGAGDGKRPIGRSSLSVQGAFNWLPKRRPWLRNGEQSDDEREFLINGNCN